MHYTFGHTNIAVDRLKTIADFFNPLAVEFIRSFLSEGVTSAADLGCGPGYTTDMLAEASFAPFTTGLDNSAHFIRTARKNYPQHQFNFCDLTHWTTDDSYDIMYCRFLLSHLNNLKYLLHSWINHLNKGGKIFIDELEAIQTEIPVFRRYLEINNRLIGSQGATLFVGKNLDKVIEGVKIIINKSDRIIVKDSLAATWFYPNTVSVWNEDKFILKHVPTGERKEISDDLLEIKNSTDETSNITWTMKRIILTK